MRSTSRLLLVALAALLSTTSRAQDGDSLETVEEIQAQLRALDARLESLRDRLAGRQGGDWSSPERRLAGYARHVALRETSPHADLRWQWLGPTNISGRVTDVEVVAPRGKSYRLYVATASGGVWRSDNEGTTWEPVFDDAATTSIGDVTLAPSDPDVVYVGTGEANIFRSSMAGVGVFRSDDGGDTWRHLGLGATNTIARIVVHPADPDVVYVAASGHEWTDNPERGVYRSRDGGATWERVLYVDEGTGAIDLVMDPTKPEVLYAATWERRRELWNDPRNDEHSRGSGVWRSTDGGDTWSPMNEGLPAPEDRGRIGIDLCRSNPSVLYAFVDHYELVEPPSEFDSYGRRREAAIRGATVFRSDDRGETWAEVEAAEPRYMRRLSATYGWVFGQIRVDPNDEDTIYVMGLSLNVSNDGGKTFRRLRGMHGDHHALWIDPDNSDYLVNGNDGGVAISYDGGEEWRTFYDELPVVQFYNVGFDMAEPFHVYGSIQDHGSRRAVVDLSRGRNRVRPQEWEWAPGGEASTHQPDPTDPDVVYAAGFYGRIFRQHISTGERVSLELPEAGDDPLRGQWLAPFLISPHNPRIVYHGMNRLLRSMDRGEGFEAISPDLTTDDPARRGDISYQTISSISESPLTFGHLYVGTDDGRLHTTRDSGATWTEIVDGLAADRWISRVEASRFDAETVYVAQNGKRNDDFAPYLWRSRDGGATWRSLADGIPLGPINVVREDPRDPAILYVGTDSSVYVSTDGGGRWDVLGAALPTSYVHDLAVHPRDDVLVAATHGRGVWLLDLAPLRPDAADDDLVVESEFGVPPEEEGEGEESEEGDEG